jgi:agmatinase
MKQEQFLGLESPFCDEQTAKVVVLPVPFDQTTSYTHGTDKGPSALIEASKNLELYDIATDSEMYKEGIHTAQSLVFRSSEEMVDGVYKDVLKYLKRGKFVVTLGGEHAISQGPIRAHREHFGAVSVLQFDAHTDLRPEYEGTRLSHASVMSRVQELPDVNIVSVGIRSMSVEEKAYWDPSRIFFAHELHLDSEWMDRAIDLLSDRVYITFDLDVFDSSLMPSTGTPEPGGMFWHQVEQFITKLTGRKKVIGLDVVELCPIQGFVAPDFLAAKLTYKILSSVFQQKVKQSCQYALS